MLVNMVVFMIVFALTPAFLVAQDLSVPDDVRDVVDSIRKAREALSPGRFEVTATCPIVAKAHSSYENTTRVYDVAIHDDKGLRKFIMKFRHPSATWTAKVRIDGEKIFLDPGAYAPHANIGSLDSQENLRRFVFDPLSLGLLCRPVLEMQGSSLHTSLSYISSASDIALAPADGGLWHITCRYGGGTVEYVVNPAKGYAVTSVVMKAANSDVVMRVDSRYQSVAAGASGGRRWYPASVIYRNEKAGAITFQENLKIVYAPDSTLTKSDFSLATLDLIEGRRVVGEDLRVMMWSKGRLRQVTGSDVYDAEEQVYQTVANQESLLDLNDAGGHTLRNMLVLGNLILAMSALAIYLTRRKRKSPTR